MMYIYKWIEGKENLKEFCLKRFKDRPHFTETIGRCGQATIYLIYKYRDETDWNKGCVEMYLLFMEHPSGTHSFRKIQDMMYWTYEKIKADKTSIIK